MGEAVSKVAVVIPFYQEKPGILRRAVESVLRQQVGQSVGVCVFIVDDISPVPVADEIDGLNLPPGFEIAVHAMARNGGPGAARNVGLTLALDANAECIALLDSDDEWTPDHLENAVAQLRAGHDVYFCDHRRTGDYPSAFAVDSPRFWAREDVREAVAGADAARTQSFTLAASTLQQALVYEYIFQTSTVVFRSAVAAKIRFDDRLRSAGEDHLFWFDLATETQKFAVSRNVEVICGLGVNVYFGSLSWADPRAVDRHGYRFLLFCEMIRRPQVRASDAKWLRTEAKRMRGLYAYLLLRHVLRGNLPNFALLRIVLTASARLARGPRLG